MWNGKIIRRWLTAVVAFALAATASYGQNYTEAQLKSTDAFAIGLEAYIYGYPLVMMGVTERLTTNVHNTQTQLGRAPINQFANNATLPNSSYKDVVLPNVNTLYSLAWLDLSGEPVVLHLPNVNRFFLMQVVDAWTSVGGVSASCTSGSAAQSFCSLGTRYGTGEGNYAFVGPGWHKALPSGITQVIRVKTNTVWIIGRTYTDGSQADIQEVAQNIQPNYRLTPLSQYGHAYTPPADSPVDPTVDISTPPRTQVANMDACAFFSTMAAMMRLNPPYAQDAPTVQRMATIGLSPNNPFVCSNLSLLNRAALQLAVLVGQDTIVKASQQQSMTSTGWVMALNLGDYGRRYLLRAGVAYGGIGANLYKDAIYAADLLTGGHNYVLHFDAGQLPPANPAAFWSVTMYNRPGEYLVANPINRYAIGIPKVQNHLPCLNADGSLDIYIQNAAPADQNSKAYCNWLPAPTGNFLIVLRMYWPEATVLDGQWIPPRVQQN